MGKESRLTMQSSGRQKTPPLIFAVPSYRSALWI